MLLIDVSGSLDFGTRAEIKRDVVTEISATLAFSAIQNNDKIGVVFFSDKVEKYIPPKKGRKHILYIIHEMLDFKPQSRKTDISCALEFLVSALKRKCTAFLISDFYARKSFEKQMMICSNKHDVVAIQVFDPFAKTLPDVGLMKIMDLETEHEMYIDTSDKKLRNAHSRYWQEREQELESLFKRSNVDSVAIATNEDYVKSLIHLFIQRS